jgi:hypothetical protein
LPPETELGKQADIMLRAFGWHVVNLAADKATRRQQRGIGDRLCWWNDHFLELELKAPGGRVRDSQHEHLDDIKEHLGLHVDNLDDLEFALHAIRGMEM